MMRRIQEQQAVRPALLIGVAAVAVAVLAFVIVNLFLGGGGKGASQTTTTTTNIAPAPLPNLTIPTAPPAPAGSGRDPFQPVVAAATPAPVTTPTPVVPEFSPAPKSQAISSGPAYLQVLSIAANHTLAAVRDGTIVYEQAHAGQTLDRGIVIDKIDSCVHMHRGSANFSVCPGQRVLV
jgi:type IV secretory pathway VirB10-like protein